MVSSQSFANYTTNGDSIVSETDTMSTSGQPLFIRRLTVDVRMIYPEPLENVPSPQGYDLERAAVMAAQILPAADRPA